MPRPEYKSKIMHKVKTTYKDSVIKNAVFIDSSVACFNSSFMLDCMFINSNIKLHYLVAAYNNFRGCIFVNSYLTLCMPGSGSVMGSPNTWTKWKDDMKLTQLRLCERYDLSLYETEIAFRQGHATNKVFPAIDNPK